MKYFYINNTKYNFSFDNISIIDFCKNIGIDIPYFCYHKRLSLAGNCRMCLIELKPSLKPVVSCTMTILNKMHIYTNSPLVKKARENILEFLLLNHPLDCPICDQGGECDLQDQSFVYGNTKKRFYNFKRIVSNKNIGPIVKMVMTRCIHCTRCVRFANEIAGVNDLGIFNRGVHSEIGTYVNKTFSSELSGNVIDICPVGALTSKQYPFVNRNWEIKVLSSIDYTDGFGLNTIVSCKNNTVIKVQPNLNFLHNDWISDKTRFSFDGMFSINRVFNFQKIEISKYWDCVFNNIKAIVYFKDHLSNHILNKKNFFNILIIITDQVDIKLVTLLILLQQKYSFLKIKRLENTSTAIDLEESILTNSLKHKYFKLSQLCLLLNINTRYESYSLNLRLRQNFHKENLKVYSLNSLLTLTFPTIYLGSTNKITNLISEGNHIVCQELSTNNLPTVFFSSETLKKKDLYDFSNLYYSFKKYNPNFYNINWNGFNTVNTTLGLVGMNFLNKLTIFSEKDLNNFNILYLLNIKYNYINEYISKYLELKLLTSINKLNLIVLEQNFMVENNRKSIKLYSKNFFESENNLFFNTEGKFKSSNKIIMSQFLEAKNSQFIIKTLNLYLNKIKYFYNKHNQMSRQLCYLPYLLNNILNLIYLPSNYITTLKWNYSNNQICSFSIKSSTTYKKKKLKIFTTKLFLWLEDYYINGKDLYSTFSIVMLQCSNTYRKETTNFLY